MIRIHIAILALSLAMPGCMTSRSTMREIQADLYQINAELNQQRIEQQRLAQERQRILKDVDVFLSETPEGVPSSEYQTGSPLSSLNDSPARHRFDNGMAYYNQANYQAAAEEFLLAYPLAESDELRINSLYWLGESYFRLKDWRRAIHCYDRVESEYSDSDLAPAAMLKKGICLIESGQPAEGRAVLELLIDRYPDAPAAPLAKERVDG